jgi:hypothetical protein
MASHEESRIEYTVVFPKEGQMRFAGQVSLSNRFALLWASERTFLDLERYLRKLA